MPGMRPSAGSVECPFSQAAKGMPTGWDAILLMGMLIEVMDGDTFNADLELNRRISGKKERIQLLYVDTPELS